MNRRCPWVLFGGTRSGEITSLSFIFVWEGFRFYYLLELGILWAEVYMIPVQEADNALQKFLFIIWSRLCKTRAYKHADRHKYSHLHA